ncbi:MAG TPA: hypothetical protein VGF18_05040 [Candidatus Tumulicola sp.]|jgi:sugar lactone lactonase YvrE
MALAPARGWMSPEAKKHGAKVYIADLVRNVVRIYTTSGGNEIGEITAGIDGPYGMWVTPSGTLYVSNAVSGTITAYLDGQNSPSTTLGGATNIIGVAVSKQGVVYGAGFSSNAVYVYAKGATSPTKTLALAGPEGFGIDAKQNVFAAYNDGYTGHVEEYSPNGLGGKDLGISSGMAADAKIDKSGNLLLGDQSNHVIHIFPPDASQPSGSIADPTNIPFKFAFNKRETLLYVASIPQGTVNVYSYPSGVQKKTVFNGLLTVSAVAVSPPAPY